jgi:hypothetical protein
VNVASLLICAVLVGQVAAPPIDGPEQIAAGRLAVFRIEAQPGIKALWKIITPDGCKLAEADVSAAFEDNHALAFASPVPGKYRIVVALADSSQLWLIDRTLVVESSPSPGPGPEPGPPLPGPGPSPNTEWAKWAYAKSRELVPESFRVREAALVADALRAVCEAIAAGRIADARRARESVRQSVREVLGTVEAINRWQSFSNALDAELDKIQEKLKSPADYAAVWRDVAEGLVWRQG